jgi:hypothetical protein
MTLFALVGLAIVWRLPGGRPEEQTAEPLAASEPRESSVGSEAAAVD